MRYDENGKIIKDFILNKDPYDKAKILLAGKILDVAPQGACSMGPF